MQMTDKTAGMLVDNINDIEEPFSSVMELTAKSVTGCLTNVLSQQLVGLKGARPMMKTNHPQRYNELTRVAFEIGYIILTE